MSIIYCIPYPKTYRFRWARYIKYWIYWISKTKANRNSIIMRKINCRISSKTQKTNEWTQSVRLCVRQREFQAYYMFDVCMNSNDLISFYRYFFSFFSYTLRKLERIESHFQFYLCIFLTFISCWVLFERLSRTLSTHYLHK